MDEFERYRNREQAGILLAKQLISFKNDPDGMVLALPRGGVPVAYQIANLLNLPLDVYLVKKITTPQNEEYAIGAVSSGGEVMIDRALIKRLGIEESELNISIVDIKNLLSERELLLRGTNTPLNIKNKKIILVDDGLATGATMLTAIRSIKKLNPAKIIVAIPVASSEALEIISQEVDEVICPLKPQFFYSVSIWYENFKQTTDEEVIHLLNYGNENHTLTTQIN